MKEKIKNWKELEKRFLALPLLKCSELKTASAGRLRLDDLKLRRFIDHHSQFCGYCAAEAEQLKKLNR